MSHDWKKTVVDHHAELISAHTSLVKPPEGSLNPKDVAGSQKVSLRLVPLGALVGVAAVLANGAAKYGPFNWRQYPIGRSFYYEAAIRHLIAALDGEDIDPESGLPHIDHAIAGLMIERDALANGTNKDDRQPAGVTGALIRAATKPLKEGP